MKKKKEAKSKMRKRETHLEEEDQVIVKVASNGTLILKISSLPGGKELLAYSLLIERHPASGKVWLMWVEKKEL